MCWTVLGSRQIYAHQAVSSIYIRGTVQQCYQVGLLFTGLTAHETYKTWWLCLLCVTVWDTALEGFIFYFYLFIFFPPTARAVQLYEVCQHYQLRGSLQSKHSDCRVILKKREATIERQELERGRAIERACGKWKHGGEKSTRLSGGGVEFDSERGRQKGGRDRGCQTRKRDFNVSKDFPITVADTLHTQLTISRTLTAAQIGWKRFPGQGLWSGVGVYVCLTLCCVSR